MRTCLLLVFSLLLLQAQGQKKKPSIVLPGEKLNTLFSEGFFLEGPAVNSKGEVYFSDITFTGASGMQPGYIWKYDPETGKAEIFRSPAGMSNGIVIDENDDIIVAMGADFGCRCIMKTDLQTKRSKILAGLYDNRSFNSPNDLVIHPSGRIYFTDPRYSGHEPMEQPFMSVYMIDLDGSVERVIDRNGQPNGVVVSPDGKYLYVASIFANEPWEFNGIMRYEITPDGTVQNGKIFVKNTGELGPDGMTVDSNGNIYAARPAKNPGVYIYSPEGEELDYIATPTNPTNVTFGKGNTRDTLYITAGKYLYSVRVNRGR